MAEDSSISAMTEIRGLLNRLTMLVESETCTWGLRTS